MRLSQRFPGALGHPNVVETLFERATPAGCRCITSPKPHEGLCLALCGPGGPRAALLVVSFQTCTHVTIFQVPVGTLVKEGSEVVADLSHPGEEYVAAVGGAGGKGNRFFLANNSRAPVTCTPGQPGQERVLFLELKTVAHAGLVGVTRGFMGGGGTVHTAGCGRSVVPGRARAWPS